MTKRVLISGMFFSSFLLPVKRTGREHPNTQFRFRRKKPTIIASVSMRRDTDSWGERGKMYQLRYSIVRSPSTKLRSGIFISSSLIIQTFLIDL